MQRRQILLVDVFADEPTGGRTVAVDPTGELSEPQKRRVASELGTSGVVSAEGTDLHYTDCDGSTAVVSGAVGGAAGLYNRGALAAGEYELQTDDSVSQESFSVELDESGTVTVEIPSLVTKQPSVDLQTVATALGIDVAAMQDVGADLPLATVEAFGGTLLVPVNFLQHLSGATPSVAPLSSLLSDVDTSRAFVFTFDTLGAHTDVHARVFDPSASGNERPASGVGAAACVAHLSEHAVFDGEREEIAIECGQFLDRPGTIRATVSEQPLVGGGALTTLDSELGVPEDGGDDEIIEL